MSDDHGLGLKVHEDAYRELEEKLAKQKAKLEEIGSRACCVLLERDAARHQRDMLAEALRKAVQWADCASIHIENRHEINWTHLNEAKEALATVKGDQS